MRSIVVAVIGIAFTGTAVLAQAPRSGPTSGIPMGSNANGQVQFTSPPSAPAPSAGAPAGGAAAPVIRGGNAGAKR